MTDPSGGKAPVLVTGAAGFIGFHVARALLDAGTPVIGVDSMNAYYDPKLKEARLRELQGRSAFTFHCLNLADREQDRSAICRLAPERGSFTWRRRPACATRSSTRTPTWTPISSAS